MVTPVLAESIAPLAGIAHGFFTRAGGVSSGIYASLNCGLGSGDGSGDVRENRARVARFLGADHLLSAHQVHGTQAFIARAPWTERPRADAIVTSTRNLAIGVLTADCAPILFADGEARVVAAAHAGWRGALAGIVEATIAAMEELGAKRARIRAAVGPCIGQQAYEVGSDFEKEFLSKDAGSAPFFVRSQRTDRPHFDLAGYVVRRVQEAGVTQVLPCSSCTYSDAGRFFSYRRAQARNEPDYGRQISAIVLT
jgi:polyphenol oxidase